MKMNLKIVDQIKAKMERQHEQNKLGNLHVTDNCVRLKPMLDELKRIQNCQILTKRSRDVVNGVHMRPDIEIRVPIVLLEQPQAVSGRTRVQVQIASLGHRAQEGVQRTVVDQRLHCTNRVSYAWKGNDMP